MTRIHITLRDFFGLFECHNTEEVETWHRDCSPRCNTIVNTTFSIYVNMISNKEISISKRVTLNDQNDVISHSNATIVLVIGESYSKHHSNLYDYIKNTNPNLLIEKKKGNLFVFNDAISPFNVTSDVLKNLFSTNSIMDKEYWFTKPIFPAIFKKAGFNVYFWDNQKTIQGGTASDYSIFSYIYAPEIIKVSYTKCNNNNFQYDKELLKSFFSNEIIQEQKNLLIFHLKGQHVMAQAYYPQTKKYLHFTTDSIVGHYTEQQKSHIAHYDNATRYNDDVIMYLINQLKNKECAIVYLSDHGEEIHDYRNLYGRSHEMTKNKQTLKYQYQIPFMIWCSEKYKMKHPNKIRNIQGALNNSFMNDNTCQVLFDLADIQCVHYNPKRDPINPEFKPFEYRIVQKNNIYETIMNE